MNPRFETLTACLEAAASSASPPIFIFLDDDKAPRQFTAAEIRHAAHNYAVALLQQGVAPGECIPIVLPTSVEFVITLFGVLLVGAVPCPIAPPTGFAPIEEFVSRTQSLAKYLEARWIVGQDDLADDLARTTGLAVLRGPSGIDATPPPAYSSPAITAEHLGLIQCTSGSTGRPKGVMLTHRNLISNVHQIGMAVQVRPSDVTVCWLPLNHDMGLIGGLLFSMYWGVSLVLIPPGKFLRNPSIWLSAISKYRGTLSPAPNFAYGYTALRVKDSQLAGIDLSSWRAALVGAEPICAKTLRAFERRFASCRFDPNAFLPCYGLAEATLAVTFHTPGTPVSIRQREQHLANGAFDESPTSRVREVVSCGISLPWTRVRVVDDQGNELLDRRVGNVQVKGPGVMRGYYKLHDLTSQVIHDGWLDTGDQGYLYRNQLFITGRRKDVIIIRGKCHPPQEIEWAAEEVEGIRPGGVAAFGMGDERQGTELLYVVCEARIKNEEERERLREEVNARVCRRTGLTPNYIYFVAPGTIPKTTSGKLQRSKLSQMIFTMFQGQGDESLTV
jgi:acyl-CoA synthetase (AMP-forming)/AMP-acid ligase II